MIRFAFICLAFALAFAFLGFAGVPEYTWDGGRVVCVTLIAVAAGALAARRFKRPSW